MSQTSLSDKDDDHNESTVNNTNNSRIQPLPVLQLPMNTFNDAWNIDNPFVHYKRLHYSVEQFLHDQYKMLQPRQVQQRCWTLLPSNYGKVFGENEYNAAVIDFLCTVLNKINSESLLKREQVFIPNGTTQQILQLVCDAIELCCFHVCVAFIFFNFLNIVLYSRMGC